MGFTGDEEEDQGAPCSSLKQRRPSLGKTMALLNDTRVCTPHSTLFLYSVNVRSCGHAHNPSALGGLPFVPDTSAEIMTDYNPGTSSQIPDLKTPVRATSPDDRAFLSRGSKDGRRPVCFCIPLMQALPAGGFFYHKVRIASGILDEKGIPRVYEWGSAHPP